MDLLSRNEELLLLAVWRLQEEAYGLAVRRCLFELTGRKVSVTGVYLPLDRLHKKGYLTSWESDPTEKRGGRRKRYFKLTAKGVAALNEVRRIHEVAWHGLPEPALG